ncbi:MAG: phosphocholine cytidylyltransferase family protein [Gammaproteobacteria bacterium]|jgi:choline kinase
MKVIILSAGQGRRLLPLTENMPKCALPVLGRSILAWQLHEIAKCPVDEVVVVTGFGADRVDDILARDHGVPVRALYNPFYAHSDNLGTCWVARSEMEGPFVVLNGDTLFEADIMQRLLARGADSPITLATDVKSDYDPDDMKIISQDRRLLRVGKQLELDRVNGESIGMMVFRGEGIGRFRDKLDYLMRFGEGLNRWYLSAIDALAREWRVGICPIQGLSWCEIDNRSDLSRAEIVLGSWQKDAGLTGAGILSGGAA